ncbi:hypothetical protein [Litchfieldia salsa]|uniref:Uncharacterized protein n=1 Tax=Litchfieldia salsa TaxID=930152 RepID=A0A1H0UT71_9BACI|nr:hypothetical protein [Litchfieldia salsa]SDP69325.1 hypothetical protein SAMN05216565_105147 [Litchfieldia salsa]
MYYYHPGSYHPIYPRYYPGIRQQTPVDSNILYQSANVSKKLMKEASIVLDRLAQSKEFDSKLMYAAQISDINEVKRLIHSTGVTSDVDVYYNPDGLRLEFKSNVEALDCCKLTITLRWR